MPSTTQLYLTKNHDLCAVHGYKEHTDNYICQYCLDYSKLFPNSSIAKKVSSIQHTLDLDRTIDVIKDYLYSYIGGFVPSKKDLKPVREEIAYLISMGKWAYTLYHKHSDMAATEYSLYKLSLTISEDKSLSRKDIKELFGFKDATISRYLKQQNRQRCTSFTYQDITNVIKMA